MRKLYEKVPLDQVLPDEMPQAKGAESEPELFYCPVYEGFVEEYDCSEICVGIHRARYINDGIPYLMDINTAMARRDWCYGCKRFPPHFRPSA
jgi:hypothetical protein